MDLLSIALNPRMTPDAVRVTLYFAALSEGVYDFDALSELLEEGGEKRVRKALARAEKCGYLTRIKGGRGSDRFSFTGRSGREEAFSQAASAGEKPTVVEEGEGDIPPNSPPLSFSAMRAISDAGEKLTGCRGSLVDYLKARVTTDRQYAYVQAVVSWIDNPSQVFQQANGVLVPPQERLSLLAIALNELAASDESKYKAPGGDVRNLKNKLGILAKGFGVKATGTDGPSGYRPRTAASDTQDYKPTNTWSGEFNG